MNLRSSVRQMLKSRNLCLTFKFFQKLIDVIVYIGVNFCAGKIILATFARNSLILVVVWW